MPGSIYLFPALAPFLWLGKIGIYFSPIDVVPAPPVAVGFPLWKPESFHTLKTEQPQVEKPVPGLLSLSVHQAATEGRTVFHAAKEIFQSLFPFGKGKPIPKLTAQYTENIICFTQARISRGRVGPLYIAQARPELFRLVLRLYPFYLYLTITRLPLVPESARGCRTAVK